MKIISGTLFLIIVTTRFAMADQIECRVKCAIPPTPEACNQAVALEVSEEAWLASPCNNLEICDDFRDSVQKLYDHTCLIKSEI